MYYTNVMIANYKVLLSDVIYGMITTVHGKQQLIICGVTTGVDCHLKLCNQKIKMRFATVFNLLLFIHLKIVRC